MEITGKVIAALPLKSGVSASTGNEWSTQDYVIETTDQFSKKCCFNVFGKDKIEAMKIQVGEELKVSFDIDAHEYQGRWFNSIRAWKVERVSQDAVGTEPQGVAGTPTDTSSPKIPTETSDDLPF